MLRKRSKNIEEEERKGRSGRRKGMQNLIQAPIKTKIKKSKTEIEAKISSSNQNFNDNSKF